jgi:polysaccharide deacetylase family protein (PEP-CTERM system associated)
LPISRQDSEPPGLAAAPVLGGFPKPIDFGPSGRPVVRDALSIDVEEWFCATNIASVIPPERWDSCPSRVVESTRKILEILGEARATFFVLGWVAERHPHLVREIAAAGHEVATHGYAHVQLDRLTPEEFADDLGRSLEILRNLSPDPVIGYRAPSFSITERTYWALPILEAHGIRYDSSIVPVAMHPTYGVANAPRVPHRISPGLLEFPPAVLPVLGVNIPIGGGAYFRLLPYPVTALGLRRLRSAGDPFVFYLHPWELDPSQPRVRLPWGKRLRHYTNLARTEARLRRLLRAFRFTTIREALGL